MNLSNSTPHNVGRQAIQSSNWGEAESANVRFKRRMNGFRWVAAAAAVVVHAVILVATPAFNVEFPGDGEFRPRMILTAGNWSSPTPSVRVPAGYVHFEPTSHPPRWINRGEVNHRIPRIYSPSMWEHREPTSARIQLSVTRFGNVSGVALLDGSDNGGHSALLKLVRRMKFQPIRRGERRLGFVCTVDVGIVTP